ncbi:MAG: hypothetical protein ABI650_08440 [Dokdonella sp.]
MSFFRRYGVLSLGIATALFATTAMASEISAQEAVDRVQKDTNAKVLSVQTLHVGTRKIYRIKLLTTGGQVRVVEVRANE